MVTKKQEEFVLSNLVAQGAVIQIGQYQIYVAANGADYYGNKEFVVEYPYRHKLVGFNTVLGAIKHIEKIG